MTDPKKSTSGPKNERAGGGAGSGGGSAGGSAGGSGSETGSAGGGGPAKPVIIIAALVLIGLGTVWILVSGGGGPQGRQTDANGEQRAEGGEGSASGDDGGGVAPPETADALLRTARAALDKGRAGEAIRVLEAGIEKHPRDQMMRGVYGEALIAQGRSGDAYRAFQDALSVGGENPSLRDLAANLAYELGDYDEAANHWALAQKAAPDNPKYPLHRAQALRKLHDHDAARTQLVIATKLDPAIHEAWGGLAGIAMDAGNLNPALQHILKARELAPDNETYLRTEATIRRRLGQHQRAAELLLTIDESRRLRSDELLGEIALCYGAMREPGRAADMYTRATQRRPKDAGLYFELAQWARRADDLELALAASERAYELGDQRAIAIVEDLRAELGV